MKRKLQITSLISKTAADIGLTALRNIVSDQIAIDMGSSSMRIWVSGHGVVVDEPSAIAVKITTGEVLAVGLEAEKMLGRELETSESRLRYRQRGNQCRRGFAGCDYSFTGGANWQLRHQRCVK